MLDINEFRSILIDNGLIQADEMIGGEWTPLLNQLEYLQNPVTMEKASSPWLIDAAELIDLIKVFDKGNTPALTNAGGSVKIKDAALKKYLRLSLHKLLYLRLHPWGLPSLENEEKTGQMNLPTRGCEVLSIANKDLLGGWDGDNGFFAPFSDEELKDIEKWAKEIIETQKIQAGRKGRAALGDMVIRIKAECPEKVLQMNQTERLNFIADLMQWAGFLENVPKAKERQQEGMRDERKDMLRNWVREAKEVEMKTFYKDCKKCPNFMACPIRQNLKCFEKI